MGQDLTEHLILLSVPYAVRTWTDNILHINIALEHNTYRDDLLSPKSRPYFKILEALGR
jgi:hypothetical protein